MFITIKFDNGNCGNKLNNNCVQQLNITDCPRKCVENVNHFRFAIKSNSLANSFKLHKINPRQI